MSKLLKGANYHRFILCIIQILTSALKFLEYLDIKTLLWVGEFGGELGPVYLISLHLKKDENY